MGITYLQIRKLSSSIFNTLFGVPLTVFNVAVRLRQEGKLMFCLFYFSSEKTSAETKNTEWSSNTREHGDQFLLSGFSNTLGNQIKLVEPVG